MWIGKPGQDGNTVMKKFTLDIHKSTRIHSMYAMFSDSQCDILTLLIHRVPVRFSFTHHFSCPLIKLSCKSDIYQPNRLNAEKIEKKKKQVISTPASFSVGFSK